MLAINFHYVGMPEFPFSGVHGISNAQFKKFIVWVKENKHVIDPKDLNSSKPCKLEGSADQILLTFDDGLKCHIENVLPILAEAVSVSVIFSVCWDA